MEMNCQICLQGGEGRFKLPFKVSREEVDEWHSEKEEEIEAF